MKALGTMHPSAQLGGAWCDSNLLLSSLLEATSFVTPVLERYFVRTVARVAQAIEPADAEARARARAFVIEESRHAVAHQRLNRALLVHLGAAPPGLAWVQRLAEAAERRLDLAMRLATVEIMERASARIARRYLAREQGWTFGCDYARRLFAQHAREELAHADVIAALQSTTRRVDARWIVAPMLAAAMALYLAIAVPWIAARKRGHQRQPIRT